MRISELARAVEQTEVEIRGVKVPVRFVPAAESDRLSVIFPRPVPPEPPMVPDPNRGSKAPKVPDTEDPKYRAALAEHEKEMDHWWSTMRSAVVVVACGLVPARYQGSSAVWDPGRRQQSDEAYLREAVEEVGRTLSAGELAELYAAVNRLHDGVGLMEESEKNSSTPTSTGSGLDSTPTPGDCRTSTGTGSAS